jgi:hypothetical protein
MLRHPGLFFSATALTSVFCIVAVFLTLPSPCVSDILFITLVFITTGCLWFHYTVPTKAGWFAMSALFLLPLSCSIVYGLLFVSTLLAADPVWRINAEYPLVHILVPSGLFFMMYVGAVHTPDASGENIKALGKSIAFFSVMLVAIIGGFAITIPFIGWSLSYNYGENRALTVDYNPFLKVAPSLKFHYFISIDCGYCEAEYFEKMDANTKKETIQLCVAKFGINDLEQCMVSERKWYAKNRPFLASVATSDEAKVGAALDKADMEPVKRVPKSTGHDSYQGR